MTDNKVQIIKQIVTKDKMETSRVSVTFLVKSEDIGEAQDYVISDEIIEKGMELCRKSGVVQVGLNARGTPTYCDKDGNPLSQEGEAPEGVTAHYYKATHVYIGSN